MKINLLNTQISPLSLTLARILTNFVVKDGFMVDYKAVAMGQVLPLG
jgi:hypothetical protein